MANKKVVLLLLLFRFAKQKNSVFFVGECVEGSASSLNHPVCHPQASAVLLSHTEITNEHWWVVMFSFSPDCALKFPATTIMSCFLLSCLHICSISVHIHCTCGSQNLVCGKCSVRKCILCVQFA